MYQMNRKKCSNLDFNSKCKILQLIAICRFNCHFTLYQNHSSLFLLIFFLYSYYYMYKPSAAMITSLIVWGQKRSRGKFHFSQKSQKMIDLRFCLQDFLCNFLLLLYICLLKFDIIFKFRLNTVQPPNCDMTRDRK